MDRQAVVGKPNLRSDAVGPHRFAIEYVDPAALSPAPYNPRTIGQDALKRLAGLLDAHGFVDPVIARREDRLIIGGHQRLRANKLRRRPDEKVPVIFLDGITDDRAKALNIALNNPRTQGEFDRPALAELLSEVDIPDEEMPQLTGFSQEDISEMLAGAPTNQGICGEPRIGECWQVAAECESEAEQRELYERLTAEGYTCRLLVL